MLVKQHDVGSALFPFRLGQSTAEECKATTGCNVILYLPQEKSCILKRKAEYELKKDYPAGKTFHRVSSE